MKCRRIYVLLIGVLLLALGAFLFYHTSRAVAETPIYKVIRTDAQVQIRDYPALRVAITPIKTRGFHASFDQLSRFIRGDNEGAQKIATTTPVLIDFRTDKRTMSFIMPKTTVEKGVPKPLGDKVTLGEIPAARYAVMRFAGKHKITNEKAAVAKLNAWLSEQKLTGVGDPLIAYYDPPWTPVFLRRNEVLIRIIDNQNSARL